MSGVPLQDFLVLAGLLFTIGLWTALRRTNPIQILMGIELMLNGVNLNLVAFARYMPAADQMRGMVFALFVLTVAAAEAAVGLAIIIMVVRRRGVVDVNKVNLLRG
ncbi:MAG TPA: NADH-quinone oxidoreductase subunit NuoK [Bacillota bacterium]|nr:NADH-quinone oxidoreductase subunit NuoK [Bacillota bacterium]